MKRWMSMLLALALLLMSSAMAEDAQPGTLDRVVVLSRHNIRSPLSLAHPPVRFPLRFEGFEANDSGMIAEADLLAMLDNAIVAYDALEETYGAPALEAAA